MTPSLLIATSVKLALTLILLYGLLRLVRYLLGVIEAERADANPVGILRHDVWFAGIGYLVLTAAYFYPSLLTLDSHLIGPAEDNMPFYWNFWHVYHNVWHGTDNLAFTRYIFYPEGGLTYYHSWSFYNLALSIPLRTLLDPVTLYNVIILHTFPFAGIGAFLFVRYLVGDSLLAFVGGFVFAFSSFHFAHAQHHVNISSIQFIPFFALYFMKAIRTRSNVSIAMASVFLVLNALCDWNFLIFSLFFVFLAYVYLAVTRRQIVLREALWTVTTITGSAILLLLPILWPMLAVKFRLMAGADVADWGTTFDVFGFNVYVADATGFIVPNHYHWLSQLGFLQQLHALYTGNEWERAVYLGLPAVAICVMAGRRFLPNAAKYILAALPFLILSLGSAPHVFGQDLPIFLPYRVIQEVPFLSEARVPARAIVYVYLFWGVIVALALRQLLARLTAPRGRSLLAAGLFALLVIDNYSVRLDSTPVSPPAWVSAVEPAGEQFGLLNLPLDAADRFFHKKVYMLEQTFHGIPIVQGILARKLNDSLQDRLEGQGIERLSEELIQHRVKYIVMHKNFLPDDGSVDVNEYARTFQLTFEDSETVVLRVF